MNVYPNKEINQNQTKRLIKSPGSIKGKKLFETFSIGMSNASVTRC